MWMGVGVAGTGILGGWMTSGYITMTRNISLVATRA